MIKKRTILGGILLSLLGCKPQLPAPEQPPFGVWQDKLRQELRIVCLEGHAYYFVAANYGSVGGSYSMLAPKLTDEGKPVFCTLPVERPDPCKEQCKCQN